MLRMNGGPSVSAGLVDEAVGLARAAGRRALESFSRGGVVLQRKADGSSVTALDLEIERFLRAEIGARYPNDGILGEELPEVSGTSGRRWVIDPIDGTESFARGVVTFSTMLAVLDEHGPAVGVIDSPAAGETVWAGRGLGCFLNGASVRVSERTQLRGAYLATSDQEDWPVEAWLAVRAAGISVRDWGNGYGVGLVASGRVDAFVDYSVSVWDLAPMPVVIREAGGRFSALDGTERLDGRVGLLSNGSLHEELLDLLRCGVDAWDGDPTW
jgi:histidinol-phosphatase